MQGTGVHVQYRTSAMGEMSNLDVDNRIESLAARFGCINLAYNVKC